MRDYFKFNVRYVQNVTDVDDKVSSLIPALSTVEPVIDRSFDRLYFEVARNISSTSSRVVG